MIGFITLIAATAIAFAAVVVNEGTTAGQWALAVVFVLTAVFGYLDRRRRAIWDREDQDRRMKADNDRVALLQLQTIDAARKAILAEMEKSTEINRSALQQANNVNEKMAEIKRTAVAVAAAAGSAASATPGKLAEIASDIDAEVHKIKHAVLQPLQAQQSRADLESLEKRAADADSKAPS